MNEYRQDPITGRWVIVAADRDARPNQFEPARVAHGQGRATCPFCVDQMDTPPILASYGDGDGQRPWQVCVVPNLYPVLDSPSHAAPDVSPEPAGTAPTLFQNQRAVGMHEVIIESPDHVCCASELASADFHWLMLAYRDRILAAQQQGLAYAQVIKNFGPEAGASLEHAHSQVFGLPIVPQQVEEELKGVARFRRQYGQCVFCELMQAELQAQTRVVAASEQFVAWCPYASRFGYEVWLAPRQHAAQFQLSSPALLQQLAEFLHPLLQRLERVPRIKAYNYLIHTAPLRPVADQLATTDTSAADHAPFEPQQHFHWHIEIIPQIAKAAGFEWGTNVHVNTVSPEQAAQQLRDASD